MFDPYPWLVPDVNGDTFRIGEFGSPPRPRCTCDKARYATEKEAGRAVKRMRRYGKERRRYAGLLIPYMCPERKGIWHVGHTEE